MKKFKLYIILVFLLFSIGCEEDNKTLLDGDIVGKVMMKDEHYFTIGDRSGVDVTLTGDKDTIHSDTDEGGQFNFEDVPYGNYRIALEKEGFGTPKTEYQVHHLGGHSPTLVNYTIYEIPTFKLFIDSIQYKGYYERSNIYFELRDYSGSPMLGYSFRCFFSNESDVSKDNFVSADDGWIEASDIDGQFATGTIRIMDSRFQQLESDSVYIRVYPQVFYEEHVDESYQLLLGEGSNVISFMEE